MDIGNVFKSFWRAIVAAVAIPFGLGIIKMIIDAVISPTMMSTMPVYAVAFITSGVPIAYVIGILIWAFLPVFKPSNDNKFKRY